jgi:hypothetical protein
MKIKSVKSINLRQSVIQTIYDIVKAQTMDAKSKKELETEFRINFIFNY